MNTNEPKEFIEFASQYSNEYLQNNYKEIVKKFQINENAENKRKVKPPMLLNDRPLISYYSLEQYKEMTNECLLNPLVIKENVIQVLLDKYINKPLKNIESDSFKMYQNIKAGQNNHSHNNSFLYCSQLIAIEELINFENFLLNELKNEPQQNIDKKNKTKKNVKTLFDFINNVTDKKAFAEDLKNTFSTESGIPFKIMIELLKKENIFLISGGFASFYRVIEPYFSQDIGSYQGLNDLYKHSADDQTIHAEKIKTIKNKLNPLIKKYKE